MASDQSSVSKVVEFCRTNWKTLLIMTIAGFLMAMWWVPPWESKLTLYLKVGSFTASMWVLLWMGNAYSADLVSRWINWTEAPITRLIVGVVAMVVVTLSVIFLIGAFYQYVLGIRFNVTSGETIYYSLVITFIISLFMHGRGFLRNWKSAEINSEKFKKESMQAQYESLKNQVNPHFLFNSLNALTNLVYEDPDKAVKFIKQLSEVYRYVLDTRDREVVPMDEELKFLRSYLFLQKIRYGEKLHVDIEVANTAGDVAPLVLQMLLENAIKHNVISEDKPLNIRIHNEGSWIIVRNNLQIKRVLAEESAGVGLENIRKRYSFLSSKPVEVESNEKEFIVRLPAL